MSITGRNVSGDLSLVERLVRRDRMIVLAAVAAIVLLAGIYTVLGVGMNMSALDMTRLSRPMQTGGAIWTPAYAALVVLMWWIMMIAMMTRGRARPRRCCCSPP